MGSSNSTTRQSPLPRTSINLNIPEHQAAANTRQQAQFTLCWNQVHLGLASRSCRRITILLQVGHASRKLVRTWIVKSKGKRDRDKNVVQNIERQAKSAQHPWKKSWIGRARRKNGSAKLVRSYGRRGSQTLGKRKYWYCSSWEQSRVWIPTITATTSESMDWSGSKR